MDDEDLRLKNASPQPSSDAPAASPPSMKGASGADKIPSIDDTGSQKENGEMQPAARTEGTEGAEGGQRKRKKRSEMTAEEKMEDNRITRERRKRRERETMPRDPRDGPRNESRGPGGERMRRDDELRFNGDRRSGDQRFGHRGDERRFNDDRRMDDRMMDGRRTDDWRPDERRFNEGRMRNEDRRREEERYWDRDDRDRRGPPPDMHQGYRQGGPPPFGGPPPARRKPVKYPEYRVVEQEPDPRIVAIMKTAAASADAKESAVPEEGEKDADVKAVPETGEGGGKASVSEVKFDDPRDSDPAKRMTASARRRGNQGATNTER
jgi:hypothetical protein